MGWAQCGVDEQGRGLGYAVEATCDEPECKAGIDRGLAYVCGKMHNDPETCAGYFCSGHLFLRGNGDQRCSKCLPEE